MVVPVLGYGAAGIPGHDGEQAQGVTNYSVPNPKHACAQLCEGWTVLKLRLAPKKRPQTKIIPNKLETKKKRY